MKTITVNVSEVVYQAFHEHARAVDRTAAELIREAMDVYARSVIHGGSSLRDLQPLHLGEVISPLSPEDDLLEEMLG